MDRIKIIGVEEHTWSGALRHRLTSLSAEEGGVTDMLGDQLSETGEPRLRDMDAMGMDMQVLSVTTPGTQVLDLQEAVDLARDANDALSRIVAARPDRYQCFATLPTPDPAAAAEELERCVVELGHRGAMLHGRTGEKFIDHPDFAVIFDKAAELHVPIHLHPQQPLPAVRNAYYTAGLPAPIAQAFASTAWGWHIETAVNAIRLILSDAFARAPGLQVILGHWGELTTFFLERIDEMLNVFSRDAPVPFAQTFRDHCYLAPSGMWSYQMLSHALAEVGADRIVFSIDYPFILPLDGAGRRFLEQAPISPADKHRIGHLNAERLLRLDT